MSGQFRKGAEAAQEASKGGGSFAKTHYFGLDGNPQSADNTAIVRFLTDKDDWIVVDQHQNINTKDKPSDWPEGANWPGKMGSVCRGDVAFTGLFHDGSKEGRKAACYICDHVVDGKTVKKPSARTWSLAVLREEVKENGVVVGIRDMTREITKVDKDGKPTGEIEVEKAIVVVNMGFKNFYAALQGFAGHYGTVLDRDYLIKRNGTDETTTYNIIPLDPIDSNVAPANPANPQFPNRFDVRNPEHAERYKTDLVLEEVITERASDEFYARFFDKRVPSPPMKKKGDGDAAVAAATNVPKPDNDGTEGRMAALADRVKGYGAGGEQQAQQPAQQPQEAAQQPAEQPPAPQTQQAPAAEQAPAEQPPAQQPAAAGAGGMRNFE